MSDSNIPTTETGRKMLASVSPIYGKAYTAKWLFEVMGIEMEEARTYIEELRLQAYPMTATWGLPYWEMRYHIPVDNSLSVENRRQRVMAKRWTYAPMNPKRLEDYVSKLTEMPTVVSELNSEYRFEVTIISENGKMDYGDAVKLIQKAKPSHISFDIALNFISKNQKTFAGGITCTEIIAITT